MNEATQDQENSFQVQEMKVFDLLAGGFFFVLFIYTLIKYQSSFSSFQFRIFARSSLIVLAPAIVFTLKGVLNKTSITVDKTGIYHYKFLVTDWKHFIKAYVIEQHEAGSISDNFMLMIESFDEEGSVYEKKIPLSSTQNKSGEEIVQAILSFSKLFQKLG